MRHLRQDKLVTMAEIDRVIASLQEEESRAMRFEALKSDGKLLPIPFDFALGKVGGLMLAIKQLQELQGR